MVKKRNKMLHTFITASLMLCSGVFSSIFLSRDHALTGIVKTGDINIGGLASVEKYSSVKPCGDGIRSAGSLSTIEAIIFAIESINNRTDILPNITLGYSIIDQCSNPNTAVGRSVHFLPLKKRVKTACVDADGDTCWSGPEVAGIVGPVTSVTSVAISRILSFYQIPIVSPSATSVELSDKVNFEYFSRIIPPDQYQAQAIVDLVSHFNWSYISTLHYRGSYGENGIRLVKELAKSRGICIAYSSELSSAMTASDYDAVADGLISYRKARVIVAFSSGSSVYGVMKALYRKNNTLEFIWIGSDAFYLYNHVTSEPALGSFRARPYRRLDNAFAEFYKTTSPWKRNLHKWYLQAWEKAFSCDWSNATNSTPCHNFTQLSEHANFGVSSFSSFWIDSVHLLAHALHALVAEKCPEAFGNVSLVKSCVDGPSLLSQVRNVSFDGVNGPVRLTSEGDNMGAYMIFQFQRHADGNLEWEHVGWWYKSSDTLSLNQTDIQWNHVVSVPPPSVCSTPCKFGEIAIYKDVSCCWDCYRCRENELSDHNATRCQKCPEFTWPDPMTLATCEPIPPDCMKPDRLIGVCIIVLSLLSIILCIAISVVFIKHRNTKLIKATNREMSAIVLCGIILAYVTTFCYTVPPTTWMCNVRRVGFHLSCTILFATLLVKTILIYRIFMAGKAGKQRPMFISKRARLIQVSVLVLIQCIIIAVGLVQEPSRAILHMPVQTEKFVELKCDESMSSLLTPVAYNIFIVLLCAVYGFLTRRLPENFNESWFIFLSVTTTLILWLAFLPTYFTSFYAYHQVTLLGFCLILNASVTLACLFAPKVYAIYCVDTTNMHVAAMTQMTATSVSASQVAPASTST